MNRRGHRRLVPRAADGNEPILGPGGDLGRDQVADDARRKGMALHEAERGLAQDLGYEAEGTGG